MSVPLVFSSPVACRHSRDALNHAGNCHANVINCLIEAYGNSLVISAAGRSLLEICGVMILERISNWQLSISI
jgi:hypothetical protein